jgi:hypothetical protein
VRQPPGEHARRVPQHEVAREQQQQAGDDGAVDREPAAAQAPFPSGVTGTRDPHEQTRLRTAHSIFSSRPQAGQPM